MGQRSGFYSALFFGSLKIVACILLMIARANLFAPPQEGDGHDYDMIAFALEKYSTFGYEWGNSEFRAPYENANRVDGSFAILLGRVGGLVPTAYRPPVYPAILAMSYKIFGRSFAAVRIIQAIVVGVSLGLLVLVTTRLAGVRAGLFVGLMGSFDFPSMFYSGEILVESFFLFAGGIFICVSLVSRAFDGRVVQGGSWGAYVRFFALGLILGATMLLRNPVLFWLVPLFLAAVFGSFGAGSRRYVLLGICSGLFITLTPWAIRNVRIARSLIPFGTQTGPNLVFDYSEEFYLWGNGINDGIIFPHILAAYGEYCRDQSRLSAIDEEVRWNRFTSEIAYSWAFNNPTKIPRLMLIKLRSLWWTHANGFMVVLALLAVVGLVTVGPEVRWCCLIPILGTSLSAMLFQNVSGERLSVGMLPSLWILGGLGLHALCADFALRLRSRKA